MENIVMGEKNVLFLMIVIIALFILVSLSAPGCLMA
jgi:hypothetical protein